MKSKVNTEYKGMREAMIAKGTNFWRWAEARGHKYSTVISAAKKTRAGIKAVQIRRELEAFINA